MRMTALPIMRCLGTILSLLIFALWLHSESTGVDGKVCTGAQKRCCKAGKKPCDLNNADDCCEGEHNVCINGICRNGHFCSADQVDCCNLLNGLPCFRGLNCMLNCKCCDKDTQSCFILPSLLGLGPLLGFACVNKALLTE